MSDILLNGRPARDSELAALERARQCERERDLRQLAGVLSAAPPPPREPRPGTDLLLELGR